MTVTWPVCKNKKKQTCVSEIFMINDVFFSFLTHTEAVLSFSMLSQSDISTFTYDERLVCLSVFRFVISCLCLCLLYRVQWVIIVRDFVVPVVPSGDPSLGLDMTQFPLRACRRLVSLLRLDRIFFKKKSPSQQLCPCLFPCPTSGALCWCACPLHEIPLLLFTGTDL